MANSLRFYEYLLRSSVFFVKYSFVKKQVFPCYNKPMIRQEIEENLKEALNKAFGLKLADIPIEYPQDETFGDYAATIAMAVAKEVGLKPHEVAKKLIRKLGEQKLKKGGIVEKIELAGQGFINFYLSKSFLQGQISKILGQGEHYGESDKKIKSRNSKVNVQVEFISANPTGPLHAGNGRGGFGGDVLANVLSKIGYDVQREYYINDKGVQIDKLVKSVERRWRELCGEKVKLSEDIYPGEYIKDIARLIIEKKEKDYRNFTLKEILRLVKETIKRMNIRFDRFFSEQSLYDSSEAKKAIEILTKKGLTYEKEGALWFKSARFGDEKDRVLVKSNGEMTYLVSDVAYHINKFEKRKFDKVILLWGADHHGYVDRFQAMIEAIGHKGKAEIIIIQLLKVFEGGREVRMSKRKGQYITLGDVLEAVGLDAARFHFLLKPFETPMKLDLDLAKKESAENPVYYVQYAHARMSSIIRKSPKWSELSSGQAKVNYRLLEKDEELRLIKKLIQYPELLGDIASSYQVHRLTYYCLELADLFHKFYEQYRVLSDNRELTKARLSLVLATKIVLKNTLDLLGVFAPEEM